MTAPSLFDDLPVPRQKKRINVPRTSVAAYQERPRDAKTSVFMLEIAPNEAQDKRDVSVLEHRDAPNRVADPRGGPASAADETLPDVGCCFQPSTSDRQFGTGNVRAFAWRLNAHVPTTISRVGV